MDDDRHVLTLRIDRSLWLVAKMESLRRNESFVKWVCEAIRQRLERDVLNKD